MKLTFLFLVCFLASCSLVSKVEGLVDDAKVLVAKADKKYAEVEAKYQEAKAAADTNADGKTSSSEWIAWLAGGGLTTLLGFLGIKANSLQKQTDQLYDATHAPIATGPVAAK